MKISEKSRELLGSRVTVKVVNDDDALALLKIDEALEECERIEKLYSRFISGNVLAHLNERVGEWTQVSPELFYLLKFAEKVGLQTGGAFDLSVKSVLEGWGYDSDYSLTEGDAGACGEMEFSKGRVLISAEIDLGGLGKGYAIDLMRKILDGFDNFLIDAGGDIFAKGKGPDGETWKLVFEDPKDVSRAIGQVRVDNFAVACTSPLRRRWRNRHHIVDPLKLEPAGEMLTVYTQALDGMTADAYSTALFAMGYEQAKKTVVDLPVEAMLVGPDGAIWRSADFKGQLF